MLDELPAKKCCIHTVVINDWRPDICSITIPNLKRYAERIGAEFNIISKPRFPDYPPNYERLQVWEAGRDFMWNMCIDADTVLHPDFENPTVWIMPNQCGSATMTDARRWFAWNKYFERDGREIGIGDSFVVSSWLTHDIWQPLDMPFSEARKLCLVDERMVSEYCLSLNVAKFGLKFNGVVLSPDKCFHPSTTTIGSSDPVKALADKLAEWGDE